jgi:hypothetical protein
MFVPSQSIAPDSRVWIYQSSTKFTASEGKTIASFLNNFCSEWVAHGQPIKASFEIKYDQFIILFADENFNATSGCSIDSSVRAIKEIQALTGLDLFNRKFVPFLKDHHIFLLELSKLKQFYAEGMWDEHTLTFDNLITSKADLETRWIIPAGATWLKRYAPAESVKS